jgi:N-acetylglutamate synthase-like GNAT family acetyltransferase
MKGKFLNKDGEIISRKTIERTIDNKNSETFNIIFEGKKVGGVIIKINKEKKLGELETLFIKPEIHSKGIGFATWNYIERMHPEIDVWETTTPYYDKRNIHFYVNKCGFHIIHFCHKFHNKKEENNEEKMENEEMKDEEMEDEGPDEMFVFQKIMRKQI